MTHDPQRALTYVEIDIEVCTLTYGVAPCTAAIGVTGAIKCFNTKRTCQDRENYDPETETLRFAVPASYLPKDIEAIPAITSVNFTPGTVSLGQDLGERSTLEVVLRDHRHSDVGPGFDPYVDEREYNPFEQGTIFGKFRARQPFLRGRDIRLIRGFVGQTLEEMETRHFIVESFDGPTPQNATYSIIAKDVLKQLSRDRAQAPRVSQGFLAAGINDVVMSATLSPTGIGDEDYPDEGYIAIGGKEIIAYTRVGDSLTFILRGAQGTEATSHEAQDRVQWVLQYSSLDVAVILNDLLVTYGNVPQGYIPFDAWETETASFLDSVYSAVIPQPTAVEVLCSELIEQAGLAVWWDDIQRLIRLQVIRGIITDPVPFDETNVMRGSFQTQDQPDKRISQVWTYYGQINPLSPQDDPSNYRSVAAVIDLDAESDYGISAIKKIFSRWIAAFGRPVAGRVGENLLSRYRDPPRQFTFDLFRGREQTIPVLGGGYNVSSWTTQDDTGAEETVPVQVTRLLPGDASVTVEAQEMLFSQFQGEFSGVDHVIVVDVNTFNFNLKSAHDNIYPDIDLGTSPVPSVVCIIETGVIVGSNNTSTPAFVVGDWEVGVDVQVINKGRIQGAGGRGGNGGNGGDGANANSGGADSGNSGQDGTDGGVALYTRFDITLTPNAVWGGGGAGGGGGGGGGGGRYTHTFEDNDAGGGGGGGGSGGGGAGTLVGVSGTRGSRGDGGAQGHQGQDGDNGGTGQSGTATAGGSGGGGGDGGNGGHGGEGGDGGDGGNGGNGGGPGLNGSNGQDGDNGQNKDSSGGGGGNNGDAGVSGSAIDGDSFVTIIDGPGDIRGPQVN